MALSYNDKVSSGVKVVKVTGTDAFATAPGYLMAAVANGGSVAAVLSIFNATATSGTADIIVGGVVGGGTTLDLKPNGWRFTNLHAAVTGTGATAFLFYILE